MCGPNELAAGAAGQTLFGTLGAMNAARQQAKYQTDIATRNAELAAAQAGIVGQVATQQQAAILDKAKQYTGAQRAALSANGLDTSAGSAASVISDTAYTASKDIQANRYNADNQMWWMNEQAKDYRNLADYAIKAGENNANAALLNGITSLSKSFAKVGSTKKSAYVPTAAELKPFEIPGGSSKTR